VFASKRVRSARDRGSSVQIADADTTRIHQSLGVESAPPSCQTTDAPAGNTGTTTKALSASAGALTEDYLLRVTAIYERYAPEKLPMVATNLAKYSGREDDLIASLVHKYGPSQGVL
jgi:hypothetical protein